MLIDRKITTFILSVQTKSHISALNLWLIRIFLSEPCWPYHPLRGVDLDALEETWIQRYLMYCNNSDD